MKATVLESCHSTWIFDTDRKRFRRVLKDIEVGHHAVSTQWRNYFELQVDPADETFTVILLADHSRMIRSWRHTQDCVQCGGHVTEELSLKDIRHAVSV
jgi:hypothetical protein